MNEIEEEPVKLGKKVKQREEDILLERFILYLMSLCLFVKIYLFKEMLIESLSIEW
jgi:hypothetical protein